MWQDSVNLSFAAQQSNVDAHLNLTEQADVSLISQLQTTLELQQQLDLFAMHASRVIPLSAVLLETAQGQYQAAGSQAASYQQQSLLALDDEKLGRITYQSQYAFSQLIQRQLLLLENEWLYPLRNALLVQRLQQMALKDPLTTLGNRRFFDDCYNKAFQLANRHQQPFALLLLDLDNFKQVNDLAGHTMGDQVLLAVADCMRQTLRATDSLFRFGGDEFAVLLQDQDAEHAARVASRLQYQISQHPLLQLHQVGCSIGLAWHSMDHDASILFKQADDALYRAKKMGKGHIASGINPHPTSKVAVRSLTRPMTNLVAAS